MAGGDVLDSGMCMGASKYLAIQHFFKFHVVDEGSFSRNSFPCVSSNDRSADGEGIRSRFGHGLVDLLIELKHFLAKILNRTTKKISFIIEKILLS